MKKAFYKKIELDVFERVYEPREDSFLLADCVKVRKQSKVLDLGCGAGLVSVLAGLQGAKVTATDVRRTALLNAAKNARKYGVALQTIQTNMFDCVGKYDFIFFNAPYLPHDELDDELLQDEPLAVTWDGGAEGRKYIDVFLCEFDKHLKPGGRAFLLNSSHNAPEKTRRFLKQHGFKHRVAAKSSLFFESLCVFEIWK